MDDDRITDVKHKKSKNKVLPNNLSVLLTVIDGPDKGITFDVNTYEATLGRTQSDVTLSDSSVSRKHAKITYENDSFFIEDLESSNGTFINGKRITKQAINNKDHIAIGDSVLNITILHDIKSVEEETDPSISVGSASDGGERKFVTILFADISGFSGIAEQMDPEELTSMVNGCFERLIRIAYRYNGTVDKLMGDCVMVLFGAPIAHEDDPERALRCGLEMVRSVDDFGIKIGKPLQVAIGINAGTVVAGTVGSKLKKDYTVMGSAVNIAQKLQAQANPGEIRVSHDLHNLTYRQFNFETLESFKVRGITQNIDQYKLVGPKDSLSLSTTSNITRELIGRKDEVARIQAACKKAQKGDSQMMLIHGESGTGKSRLAKEAYVAALSLGFRPLKLTVRSISATMSYSLIYDLIVTALELEGEEEKAFYEKVYSSLILQNMSDDEIRFILDVFPERLQFGKITDLPAQVKMEGIFFSVTKLLRQVLEGKKVFLSVDGLQWADFLSLNLLRRLFPLLGGQTFVLLTSRTDPDIQFQIDDKIDLGPLSHKESTEMIRQVFGDGELTPTVEQNICKLSGGNPLYIEEILSSILEDKFNVDSAWNGNFEISPNLKKIMQSRIDQLPQESKDVLKHASLMGNDFDPRLLQEIMGKSVNVSECLQILRERGYVEEITDFQSAQIYCFHNQLIREVARGSLLNEQIKTINKKIGRVFEKEIDKPQEHSFVNFETLAYHFLEANDFFKAVDYLVKAADTMSGNGDNQAALRLYHQAIGIIQTHFPDQIDTLVNLTIKTARVASQSENIAAALAILNNALTAAEKAPKSKIVGHVHDIMKEMGRFKRLQGSTDEALKILTSVRNELTDKSSVELQVEVLREIGIIQFEKGELEESLKTHHSALKKAREVKDNSLILRLLNEIGLVYYEEGEMGRALTFFLESLEIRKQIGNQHSIGIILPNIARAYHRLGERAKAEKHFKLALSISQKIGDRHTQIISLHNWSVILIEEHDFKEAETKLKASIKMSREIGYKDGEVQSLIYLGMARIMNDDVESGVKTVEQGLKLDGGNPAIDVDVISKIAFAVAHYKRGDFNKSTNSFANALSVAKKAKHNKLEEFVTRYKEEYPTRSKPSPE